jgi:hypothetical protein
VPVKTTNNFALIKTIVGEGKADGVNAAAKEHLTVARNLSPLDEGRLRKSHRFTKRATEKSPTARIKAGGNVVDGELVDYAGHVNNGHATRNGRHVAGVHFWDEGMEYGRKAAAEGVAEVKRGLETGKRRPLVVRSLKEAEEVGGQAGDG